MAIMDIAENWQGTLVMNVGTELNCLAMCLSKIFN